MAARVMVSVATATYPKSLQRAGKHHDNQHSKYGKTTQILHHTEVSSMLPTITLRNYSLGQQYSPPLMAVRNGHCY